MGRHPLACHQENGSEKYNVVRNLRAAHGHSTRSQHTVAAHGRSTRSQHTVTAHRHSIKSQHTFTAHSHSTQPQYTVTAHSHSTQSQHAVTAHSHSMQSQHTVTAHSPAARSECTQATLSPLPPRSVGPCRSSAQNEEPCPVSLQQIRPRGALPLPAPKYCIPILSHSALGLRYLLAQGGGSSSGRTSVSTWTNRKWSMALVSSSGK